MTSWKTTMKPCTGGSDYRGRPGDAAFFADRRADYLARDPSQPYFSFSVTYQGHSPCSDTALEGGVYCAHDGLSDGAYCMSTTTSAPSPTPAGSSVAYVDSFREDDAPVVLVFFGDHKPTLGTGNCYYAELGVDVSENDAQGCENLYSVPYLIWANDAARRVLGDRFTGQGETISPSFLMAELFDRCGWDGRRGCSSSATRAGAFRSSTGRNCSSWTANGRASFSPMPGRSMTSSASRNTMSANGFLRKGNGD